MSKMIDLTEKRFGRLVVLKLDADRYVTPKGQEKLKWICQCDCGETVSVLGYLLRGKRTESCGCLHDELAKRDNTIHGHSPNNKPSRIYRIWRGMKARCKYDNMNSYEIYKGRGISVCDEWQEFIPFMEWALANGYADNLTIDRRDNDGNYEPSNCRWATYSEQRINQRRIRERNHLGQYI